MVAGLPAPRGAEPALREGISVSSSPAGDPQPEGCLRSLASRASQLVTGSAGSVRISLDELPRYSDWPKRLLGLEPFAVKHKTESEVLREYRDEKWGQLLKRVQNMSEPTLSEVERASQDLSAVGPCYDSGCFYLASAQEMLDKHLNLYAEVLAPHIQGASCLVELGAGYGSKIFSLARQRGFSDLLLIAAEYTETGRDLIAIVGRSLNKPIAIGYCDFFRLRLEDVTIPENAVIFTSYAVHYVPQLSEDFVTFLSRLRPRAVVHFEPCYEHYSMASLHGMMCRRYVELNDYTRNLVGVIERNRERERILVRMRENVLGSNPFLPVSVIEWAPAGRSEILG